MQSKQMYIPSIVIRLNNILIIHYDSADLCDDTLIVIHCFCIDYVWIKCILTLKTEGG